MLRALSMAVALIALPAVAQAQTIAALVGDNDIVHIDAKTWTAVKTVKITGLPSPVAGIDVRPSDGMLYALSTDGTVATINVETGAATIKSKLDTMLKAGTSATVDFNPVADRLRIMGSDGMSLRANVDDGKVAVDGNLKFKEGDANASRAATIAAGAYVNSVKAAKETTLYDIDLSGAYARQAPPNDGILNTLGKTGLSGPIAFDIATSADGTNTGWAIANGRAFRIDLATGTATEAGTIKQLDRAVRDLAVLAN
jgi:hypothetical protein